MKNTKLIFHRCGLFFMLFSLALLFIEDINGGGGSYNFQRATSVLVWALFFGASFAIFDIPKIPSMVTRIIHFVLNGIATCLWVIVNYPKSDYSTILQFIFFAVFIYVFLYWVIHFICWGAKAIEKKIVSKN